MAMVRDFSPPTTEPIRFTIAPDEFQAPPIIPARTLRRFTELASAISAEGATLDENLTAIAEAFKALLPGQPGELFAARLLSDGGPDDPPPIDLQRSALPALYYLLEEYGMRPTQPSSASVPGSTDGTAQTGGTPNGGTGSTDGASPTETATT